MHHCGEEKARHFGKGELKKKKKKKKLYCRLLNAIYVNRT